MKGIRHFLRNFTASAVKEHLRSQVEHTDGSPALTTNELELVRFIRHGPFDWDVFLDQYSSTSPHPMPRTADSFADEP